MDMPPALLYHWSPSRWRESICRGGITQQESREIEGWIPDYVCASISPDHGWGVTGASPHTDEDSWDLWLVVTEKVKTEWWPVEKETGWRTAEVPPIAIEQIGEFSAVVQPGTTTRMGLLVNGSELAPGTVGSKSSA